MEEKGGFFSKPEASIFFSGGEINGLLLLNVVFFISHTGKCILHICVGIKSGSITKLTG